LKIRPLWVIALVAIAAGIAGAQPSPPVPTITPVVESTAVHAGRTERLAVRVGFPKGFHVQSNKPRDPDLIAATLRLTPPAGITVTEIVYPPSTDLKIAGLDQLAAVFGENFDIGAQVDVAPGAAVGDITIPAKLRYQACNETMCFPPKTLALEWKFRIAPASASVEKSRPEVFNNIRFGQGEKPGAVIAPSPAPPQPSEPAAAAPGAGLDDFALMGTTGGYLNSADFLQFIKQAETGAKQPGPFEGRGPLAILLIVFLGGLALNLTPCVLPMIPINLSIIGAGTKSGSRGRGFLLGAVYGAAMALVYGVLGVIVILTAGSFGTINASPWFNLGIAVLFVFLALAMFDVFTIDFSRFGGNAQVEDRRRGTFLLAFTMGAIAALLAGACVAPVVIQVVLFASDLYAKGSAAALALPFVLGMGMALPWPLAGAGIASLPKPGMWMVRVKQVFGVLILATAAYYGYEAYGLFANRWVDATEVQSSVQEQLKAGWHASLEPALAVAKRDRTPVLIDMWATCARTASRWTRPHWLIHR